MLFAQRNIISVSLGIPVKQRKNSQLFYNAIKENYPALEDFPLVKNSTVYPYGLSSLTSHAYTRLKKTISKKKTGETLLNLLKIHEKPIKEIITRDKIREYKPYDEDSVIKIVNDFYSGKTENADDLNWLLSFEMFRKELNITES